MSNTFSSLKDIQIQEDNTDKKTQEKKSTLDSLGRSYATGKRKSAIARVWIKAGKGKISVNDKNISEYFHSESLISIVKEPLSLTNLADTMEVCCTVKGGGIHGQAESIRHGISKALDLYNAALRPALKTAGFLTRDSRVVERKKFGQPKARKKSQFSKR
jgi:small subunit ribosomal protein S9